MEDRASEGKKNPLDDIINHMTSEWHSYSLPPGGPGPGQAAAPHGSSSHVWPGWHGAAPVAVPSPVQGPGHNGPGPGAAPGRPTQPYFMLGGAEPNLPVFFQADQPPPGYQVEPQAVKGQDFFSQSIQASPQPDSNELVGTMVDVGGGNFVNVRYSGGHGGTVNPQYLSVGSSSSVSNVLPPSLDDILPHSNPNESSRQQCPLPANYGLFTPPQQVSSACQTDYLLILFH